MKTFSCSKCGSSNVVKDASARWSVKKQRWTLSDVHDQATCEECNSDADLIEAGEIPGRPFTVLLLYPDYMSNAFGQETYLAHVFAAGVKSAIRAAQYQAKKDNAGACNCAGDFFPLFAASGFIDSAFKPN